VPRRTIPCVLGRLCSCTSRVDLQRVAGEKGGREGSGLRWCRSVGGGGVSLSLLEVYVWFDTGVGGG